MIEAAYAGDLSGRVFTLSHVPAMSARRPWGAVLCHPIGPEYVNTFRAFRVLATRLAAQGVPTLRFDYRGTGDSAGDADQFALADWREDIASAVEYCRATLRVSTVALVGFRLGATLALEVAAERDDVTRLVLWEPVADGAAYLDELRVAYGAWLRATAEEIPDIGRMKAAGELFGFHHGHRLQEDLKAISGSPSSRHITPRVLLVDEGTGTVPRLARCLLESGADVTLREVQPVRIWTHPEVMEQSTVPAHILREIVSWLLPEGGV